MSFRLKTILGIAFIEIILLMILGLTSVDFLKQSNQDEIEKRAQLTANLFSIAAKDALIDIDKVVLSSLVTELSSQQEIVYIHISKDNQPILVMQKQDDAVVWGKGVIDDQASDKMNIVDVSLPIIHQNAEIGTVVIGFDRSGFDALLVDASTVFLSIAGLEVILVAIFSWLLGTYLTRNLTSLKKASEQILQGETGVQIPVSGNDEIAQATHAFNQMVENIDQRTTALTGANIRLKAIIESAADGFVIINVKGVITEINHSVTRLFGYEKEELVGENVAKLMSDSDRHLHDGYMQNYVSGGEPKIIGKGREVIAQHKDGNTFPVELSVSKMVIEGEILFLGFLKDLTDLKKNQQAAQRTESILLATLEASQDALITIDIEGKVQDFNTAAKELFGYSRDEVMGEFLENLIIPEAFQEAHRKGMEHYRKTSQGAVLHKRIEVPAHNKQGEEFPIELRVIPIQLGEEIYFTAFVRNISEQKSKEEELRLAKEQAEAGSKAKSRFLATMSHEIRSPLNAVLGSVELLLDSSLQKEQHIYATTAKEAGDALLNTINDILDFSKIEAGQMVLETHEFEPDKLVAQVLQILANKALDKGVHLASFINRNVPQSLVGDPQRLRQVIHNLVDNAIKFSDSGCVTVEMWIPNSHQERVQLCCAVTDQGIGINPEAQAKLFSEFSQVHDTHTTNYKGTGLGLAICSELVRMMDGDITVESEIGQGTRFNLFVTLDESTQVNNHYVRLPEHSKVLIFHPDKTLCKLVKKQYIQYGVQTTYARDIASAFKAGKIKGKYDLILVDDDCIKDADSKYLSMLRSDFLFPNGMLAALSTGVNSEILQVIHDIGIEQVVNKPLSRSMLLNLISGATQDEKVVVKQSGEVIFPPDSLILLAEDSPANQMVAGSMLTKKGAVIDYANNGVEALEMALHKHYDIVLMDIRMPLMDGLEATSKILEQKPEQIILAMTANVFKEELEACTNVGMLDFISKPVNSKNLIESVSKWLHHAKNKQPCNDDELEIGQGMTLQLTPTTESESETPAAELDNSRVEFEPEPEQKTHEMAEKSPVPFTDEIINTALIDVNVINSLLDVIGEKSLKNMLNVFCKETQMRVTTLAELGPDGDRNKIEDEAHTLKSSSGSFGAEKLFQIAKLLEFEARAGHKPLDSLLQQTLAVAEESVEALKKAYLSSESHSD